MMRYTFPPLDSNPRPNMCAWCNSKFRHLWNLSPTPINQSTPALVSSVSPQSSSHLATDQDDIIDETIRQIAQSVNQMLLKTSTGNHTSNLTPNDPHTTEFQTDSQSSTQTQVMFIHKQRHSQLIPTDQPLLKTALHIQLQILNKPNKS